MKVTKNDGGRLRSNGPLGRINYLQTKFLLLYGDCGDPSPGVAESADLFIFCQPDRGASSPSGPRGGPDPNPTPDRTAEFRDQECQRYLVKEGITHVFTL